MTLTGGCLCGGVRYEIRGKFDQAVNCHCSMCRKHSGAGFVTAAGVETKEFSWTKGEDLLVRYQSSPGGLRIFCKTCGSTIASSPADPELGVIWVRFGTLDDDPGVRPSSHIFVGSKAPWLEITDKLPQHKEFPES